jgi:hypothetical protein
VLAWPLRFSTLMMMALASFFIFAEPHSAKDKTIKYFYRPETQSQTHQHESVLLLFFAE